MVYRRLFLVPAPETPETLRTPPHPSSIPPEYLAEQYPSSRSHTWQSSPAFVVWRIGNWPYKWEMQAHLLGTSSESSSQFHQSPWDQVAYQVAYQDFNIPEVLEGFKAPVSGGGGLFSVCWSCSLRVSFAFFSLICWVWSVFEVGMIYNCWNIHNEYTFTDSTTHHSMLSGSKDQNVWVNRN